MIRVCGVQMAVSAKLDDNLPKILEVINKYRDADFILFPEMSLTGYHGAFSDKKLLPAWEQIATACRQHYSTALIGTGAHEDGNTYIQTRIFGIDGEVLGTHEKLVPTKGDREWCMPGEELRTFQAEGLTFGCLICNDLWVTPGCGPYPDPRLSYQLSQRGAQIIFHAVNSGATEIHRAYHEANLQLRAMEAKVPIVVANAASPEGLVNCRSGIMGADGEWLIHVPRDGEHVFEYDLEIEPD